MTRTSVQAQSTHGSSNGAEPQAPVAAAAAVAVAPQAPLLEPRLLRLRLTAVCSLAFCEYIIYCYNYHLLTGVSKYPEVLQFYLQIDDKVRLPPYT
jgi:hypothetical protein